jgi:hypothetical protein
MYGKMGTGERAELLGLDTPILREALQDYLEKRIQIPMRAATASANKEVEKQNDMLLKQSMYQHNQQQIQLVQAIEQNQQIADPVKKWMIKIQQSQDQMMKRLLRNFGYDQPDEFVPDLDLEKQNATQSQAPPPGNGFDPRAAIRLAQSPQGGPPVPSGGNGIAMPQAEPTSGQ